MTNTADKVIYDHHPFSVLPTCSINIFKNSNYVHSENHNFFAESFKWNVSARKNDKLWIDKVGNPDK